MHRIRFSLLTLAIALGPVAAGNAAEEDARVGAVAPYVDPSTLAIIRIDFGRVDVNAFFDKISAAAKLDDKELAPFKEIAGPWVENFKKAGGKDLFVVFSMADLPAAPFLVAPLSGDADATALSGLLTNMGLFPLEAVEKRGQAIVAGSKATLERLKTITPKPRPEVARAFAAAGEAAIQAVVVPSPELRRIAEEVSPTLPKEAGGGPISTLIRGVQWAAAGIDPAPQSSLKLTIQSQNAAAAEAVHRLIVNVFQALGQAEMPRKAMPNLEKILARLTPVVKEDQLTLSLDAATDLLAELGGLVNRSAQGMRSANSLKQILLALYNVHDASGKFPTAASYSKDGKPLLSWRVQILPFIEQTALYSEFHLDEPWDSEHNKKLIPRMPKIFGSLNVAANQEGKTRILAPVGAAMMFTGTNRPVQIKEVTDGTSNTIMVLEALPGQAVIWTKPDDLQIDPREPAKGLLDERSTGFNAAFADGSVHFIPATIDAKTLFALFTRNGGEIID
ncbi:MAG TPA: DUF1559 domain-containing protein, partial [Gemmataceae bacterium]|nr:DUF1559 domain-containing protein [Gemmataceae bacterium]